MSGLCFPTSSDVNDTITQIIKATDLQYVEYWGDWKEQQDSQEFLFKVSEGAGDRAIVVFTGVAVQVVARVDSSGIQSTFGLDFDGSENGGVTCETDSGAVGAAQQNIPLFDSVPREPSPGTHTLFITNKGPPLSLASFLIFGIMETATSTLEHTESILPPSSTLPQPTGTNLSSTTLILPLPHPTATSPLDTQQESTPSLSHTISGYTEVSITGSSTTTVAIQTTVEVSATPRLRGISQDVLAGAVVGGALLPLLLVGVSLWWRRRRSRLLTLKHMAGSVSGHAMAPGVTALATQDVHCSRPLAETTSRSRETTINSQKNICLSPGDVALSPSELGEEDSGQPSDPTEPHISSTIAEASLVIEDRPLGPAVDSDAQVVATNTEAKSDSDVISAVDPSFQASPPTVVDGRGRGGAPDIVTVVGDEVNVERGRARVRRLLVEEDSGVRLASGRSGDLALGEDTGSGEWEVLPPPYQEF